MSIDDGYSDRSWDDADESRPLADGEMPPHAKRALAMLLRQRFVTQVKNRVVWETIRDFRGQITTHLANMYLDLVVDEFYGVAFKRQSQVEGALTVLRDEPIPREVSFLLIHLRKQYTYWDGSDEPVVLQRDELEEFIRPLLRESGSGNEERLRARIDAVLNGAGALGLLSRRSDVDYLYDVSPAVVPLIGDEELRLLEQMYREGAGIVQDEAVSESVEGPEGMLA